MKEEKKNFIAFIADAVKDRKLRKDALKLDTPEELHKFFFGRGYKNIDIEECKKIIDVKKNWTSDDIDIVKSY